jgi:peptidoglycan/LPS O-acetylase OafA/YrhL
LSLAAVEGRADQAVARWTGEDSVDETVVDVTAAETQVGSPRESEEGLSEAADVTIEPTVAPPARNPRFPMVDAVRAIAALTVVLFHDGALGGRSHAGFLAGYLGRLSVGVPIFFVISGFLLYRPFVAARLAGTPAIKVWPYLQRRALRILPAYWVALTVLTITFGLPKVFSVDWWRFYGLVQIYNTHTYDMGMGVAWTLCVEATFYLALPLFNALVTRLSLRNRNVGGRVDYYALAVGVAISVAYNVVVVAFGWNLDWAHNLLGMFDWFALGMAVAVRSVTRGTVAMRWPGLLWVGAAAAYFLCTRVHGDAGSGVSYLIVHLLYAVIAVLVFAPAALTTGGLPARVLSNRVLSWLGLISYSIYLYHATLIPPLVKRHAATWLPGNRYATLVVVTLAVVVPVAAVSYYVVERPFASLKPGIRRRRPKAVAERG